MDCKYYGELNPKNPPTRSRLQHPRLPKPPIPCSYGKTLPIIDLHDKASECVATSDGVWEGYRSLVDSRYFHAYTRTHTCEQSAYTNLTDSAGRPAMRAPSETAVQNAQEAGPEAPQSSLPCGASCETASPRANGWFLPSSPLKPKDEATRFDLETVIIRTMVSRISLRNETV